MKKLLLALLIVFVVLSIAAPVSAGRPPPIVGDWINIYDSGAQTFPAGDPFFIAHGWGFHPENGSPIGLFSFALEVDGVPRAADHLYIERDGDWLWRTFIHNFPDGMTGSHEFTGRWFKPCQWAVEDGDIPGPCDNPVEPVETRTTVVVVTFEP